MNGGEEDYNEDEHDIEESEEEEEGEEEEEEEDEEGGVGPLANGGEVREGRVAWEVTNTCDICKRFGK